MATEVMDQFKEKREAKCPKAWQKLKKGQDALLAFYDFPAEHWRHMRTANPFESAFATLRLCTHLGSNCQRDHAQEQSR